MQKLLLVGSSSTTMQKFFELVANNFEEILLITGLESISELNVQTVRFDFSLRKIKNHWKTVNAIRALVLKFKPDIIHVHQANSYAYFTMRAVNKLNIPVILTVWGSDILILPTRGYLYKWLVRYCLNNATIITSVAKFMIPQIRKLLVNKSKEIAVSNLGIGIVPLALPKQNIIYTNRMHKKLYRIDKIIIAFEKFILKDQYKDWKLIIAASGSETENLKHYVSLSKSKSNIEFVGWLDDERNAWYYSVSKVFVSIPISDGAPVSLLEAMYCGCIPIVSDIPANKEWIKDGVNGIVVSGVDSDFLSRFNESGYDNLKQTNVDLINKNATKEICSNNFLEIYKSCLV